MAAKRRKPLESAEQHMEQPSAIILPGEGPIVREPEEIIALDKPLEKDNAEALAFNEEVLIIQLQPSSEENAPTVVDVYVNGEAKWIPVGVPTKIKRKFVEVLLRSKPISVTTSHEGRGSDVINNRIIRNTRAKYPLSIMQDPSKKGYEWLSKIMAEL